jgi:hypothetical protein
MKLIYNQFTIENAASDRTSCLACHGNIVKGEIRIVFYRVMQASDYFHLNCFIPKLNQYIRKQDLAIHLTDQSRELFEPWLQAWNSRYFPLDSLHIQSSPCEKRVPGSSISRLKRGWLESFKFLSFEDILLSITRTNKDFYHMAWDSELWRFLCERDFSVTVCSTNWKDQYIQEYHKRCIECKSEPSQYELYRCSILKRVLCNNCSRLEKYELLPKSTVKQKYFINPENLNVKFNNTTLNHLVIYRFKFEEEFREFRARNKDEAIKIMAKKLGYDHNAIVILQNFNIDLMQVELELKKKDYESYGGLDKEWQIFKNLYRFIRNGKPKPTYKSYISKLR